MELDGFWVHLDVDILDPEVMPAVDTRSEGGLQPSELTELLSGLVSHPSAIGMDICIFDPDLDPDGQHAQTLTPVVRETLRNATAPLPHAAHNGCDVKGSLAHRKRVVVGGQPRSERVLGRFRIGIAS